METYSYKCPVCGYVHLVPGYWVSYDPPAELEQPHFHEGGLCEHALVLQEEQG